MGEQLQTINLGAIEKVKFKGGEYQFSPYWGGTTEDIGEFLWFLGNELDLRDKWWDIKAGEVVFDIGCRYGSWTLPALASGAYVWAIDPCKESYWALATQLFLNQFNTRCIHSNFMLGSENKIAEFNVESNSNGEGEKRLMTTIDSLVKGKVDWIKIDTEGAELDILQGGVRTLTEYSPKLIVEYHDHYKPGSTVKIRELLFSLGYKEEIAGDHGLWSK